ncbi:hypothetical protein KUF69_11225, partial [Streptomyces sp. BV129]|nr:hypothetical protein [Streptomyces sp. BV129]
MDYCHPCRRHLNGALACPGCGAPALTAVAPVTHAPAGTVADPYGPSAASQGQAAPAPAPDPAPDAAPVPEPPRVPQQADRRGTYEPPAGSAAPEPAYDDPDPDEPDDPAPDGSRRDRKAAAHRRRRRRTLIVATGFVLAAGALSLAELGTDAPFSFDRPAASGDASPDGGAASVPPDATGAAPGSASAAATSARSASASPSDSASASPPESPTEKASESPSAEPVTERPATTPRD